MTTTILKTITTSKDKDKKMPNLTGPAIGDIVKVREVANPEYHGCLAIVSSEPRQSKEHGRRYVEISWLHQHATSVVFTDEIIVLAVADASRNKDNYEYYLALVRQYNRLLRMQIA
jgi:hypothetical protein